MPTRSGLLALVLMLVLAPAALAQSAGDDQYSDPFGDQEQPQEAAPGPAPAQPAQAPEPAPAAPAPAAPAAPGPVAAAAPAQLPRTGGDARIPALLGLVLLSAGVALRAHARRAP